MKQNLEPQKQKPIVEKKRDLKPKKNFRWIKTKMTYIYRS